ncbi:MAG: glycerol-3-phosphate dehydrogenase/oxidase [Hyphomicrobiales bacterium]
MTKTPAKSHYSVLIIGGGINGCGTFRDLCLQGVDCLLIDKGDVCSGASAAPSRLIHGGIKYLETNEFRLVKESAMERNRLLRNAPHYVKSLEVVFPSKSWFGGMKDAISGYLGLGGRIKERGALLVEIGLRIYDFYSRKVQALPDHRFYNKSALREDFPAITREAVAAGLYHEGRVTHAERLGLELILDGLAAQPGSALRTYTEVLGKPKGNSLTLKDSITGETFAVTADVVVNAGGAWIDKVNAGLGIASHYMGGSRGAHLIVKHQGLMQALQGRMMYFGCKDGRFNLIYPFFGNALVGSTDLPQADPDLASCTEEETDYLLSIVSEIFPDITLTRDDVILTYCGVRPLPRANGKDIGDVSRDHSIGRDMLPGTKTPVLSLIGGKWTTFRAFSEQSCDVVLGLLGKSRKVSTVDMAIGGGRDYPKDDASRAAFAGRLGERGAQLLDRYGTRASDVQAFAATTQDLPLATLPGYSASEIAYICTSENVRRLADLLLRRTAITMEGLLTSEAIQETAVIAGKVLGWSKARIAEEISHAEHEMQKRSVSRARTAV